MSVRCGRGFGRAPGLASGWSVLDALFISGLSMPRMERLFKSFFWSERETGAGEGALAECAAIRSAGDSTALSRNDSSTTYGIGMKHPGNRIGPYLREARVRGEAWPPPVPSRAWFYGFCPID